MLVLANRMKQMLSKSANKNDFDLVQVRKDLKITE
jgi:hypothetical protein